MLQRINDFFLLIKTYFNKIVSDEWKKKYQLLKEITLSPLWCLKEYNFINSENIVDDDYYWYPLVAPVNSMANSNSNIDDHDAYDAYDNELEKRNKKTRKNIQDIRFDDIIENKTILCQILFEYKIVLPKVIINIICIDYVGYNLFGTINVCGKWEYRSATDDPYPIDKQMKQYTNCFISAGGASSHANGAHDKDDDDYKLSSTTQAPHYNCQDSDIDSIDCHDVDGHDHLSVDAMKKYRFIK